MEHVTPFAGLLTARRNKRLNSRSYLQPWCRWFERFNGHVKGKVAAIVSDRFDSQVFLHDLTVKPRLNGCNHRCAIQLQYVCANHDPAPW